MRPEAGCDEETAGWGSSISFVEFKLLVDVSEAVSGEELVDNDVDWLCAFGPVAAKNTHHIAAAVNLIH